MYFSGEEYDATLEISHIKVRLFMATAFKAINNHEKLLLLLPSKKS